MRKITKEEVMQMTNNKKRKDFLDNYESWGVVSKNEYTKETYFECELPNGIKVVVCRGERLFEDSKETASPSTIKYFYLGDIRPWWGDSFMNYEVSQRTIIDELRALRSELA